MANVKFSDLSALTTPVDDDLLIVVDDSESGAEKSKKITFENLLKTINPPGMVAPFAMTAPTGWLECDGSAVSRTTYANLFAAISDDYGNGDGSTTFNLPNYQGRFLRGFDNSAGVDPDAASRTDRGDGTTGDAIGTKQADEHKVHTHIGYKMVSGTGNVMGSGGLTANNGDSNSGGNTGPSGGNETRPVNVSVMYCIKF